jgi:CheY-like chemotaxis protein
MARPGLPRGRLCRCCGPPSVHTMQIVGESRRTALVVDYDAWERAFAIEVLSEGGYSAIGASNGASGLRLTEHVSCDVILLDVALPEVSGPDVLRLLKRRRATSEIPVVLLGGVRDELDCPVEGYLPRPLRRDEVTNEVARVLGHDVPLAEPRPVRRQGRSRSVVLVASADAIMADRVATVWRKKHA